MSLEITTNLKLIYDVLTDKCSSAELTNRFALKRLLQSLSELERLLVARWFCKAPWNVGSLHVLSILQELGILTATEFILSNSEGVHVQLILNDFLEAEYELITNLFITAYYDSVSGLKLNELLDECLLCLYRDLLENPALNGQDFVETTKAKIPNLVPKLIQKHLHIILSLHDSNVKEAFSHFTAWINEGVDDIKFTKDLHEKLIHHNEEHALTYLFKLSSMEQFKAWKFYLILLQTLSSRGSNETFSFIKKYLKTRLTQIAAQPCKEAMLHLLLTARAATARTMDVELNISAYSAWYKQHIGEMKFVLKTEEFQAIIGLLEECVAYEETDDYLDIHATISISPPVLCGKLVQNYKSKCKQQLIAIKSKQHKGLRATANVLIIDSD